MTVRSKYDQDLDPDAVDTVFFGGPLNSHCPFVVAVTWSLHCHHCSLPGTVNVRGISTQLRSPHRTEIVCGVINSARQPGIPHILTMFFLRVLALTLLLPRVVLGDPITDQQVVGALRNDSYGMYADPNLRMWLPLHVKREYSLLGDCLARYLHCTTTSEYMVYFHYPQFFDSAHATYCLADFDLNENANLAAATAIQDYLASNNSNHDIVSRHISGASSQ